MRKIMMISYYREITLKMFMNTMKTMVKRMKLFMKLFMMTKKIKMINKMEEDILLEYECHQLIKKIM
jgi:hypothetical protein